MNGVTHTNSHSQKIQGDPTQVDFYDVRRSVSKCRESVSMCRENVAKCRESVSKCRENVATCADSRIESTRHNPLFEFEIRKIDQLFSIKKRPFWPPKTEKTPQKTVLDAPQF